MSDDATRARELGALLAGAEPFGREWHAALDLLADLRDDHAVAPCVHCACFWRQDDPSGGALPLAVPACCNCSAENTAYKPAT